MSIANQRIDRFASGVFVRRFMVALVFLVCIMGAGQAWAGAEFPPLGLAAITLKDPAHVRLISIARAGNRLVAVGEYGAIVYSDDNGQSWRQSAVPVSVTITCIAFATPQEGWAAGDYGVILHTKDGGLTWQKQIYGDQVNQLMTTAAQAYGAANAGTPAAAKALRRAGIFTAAGPDKPFLCILVMGPKRVFVFGAYRMGVSTTDGGAHWQDVSLTIGDPISHNIYGAASSASGIYLAMETGMVLQSTDSRASFKPLTQPVQATLFGVVLPTPNAILVYGVAGNIYRSSDSGATWTDIDLGTDANLTAARMIAAGHALIVGTQRGYVYVSQDGGMTFHLSAQNVGMELYDFEEAANGDVVCVGDGGVRVIARAALLSSN